MRQQDMGSTVGEMSPLGVMPKWRWNEIRVENLIDAIQRYKDAGLPVNQEWADELALLLPDVGESWWHTRWPEE